MTAGSAASRRVLARTPVAPLPASSPTRPTGITGRMSAPPETSSPGVCSFRLPQMCGFRLPLTSSGLTGHFLRSTFAEGVQKVGTIGEFFRKVARPAGLEPATIGLEGRKCFTRNYAKQDGSFSHNGSFSGSIPGWPPGRTGPPRRLALARPTTGPRRAIPPPRPTPPPRRTKPPTPPRVASGAGGGPDLWRGGRPETDAPHGISGR